MATTASYGVGIFPAAYRMDKKPSDRGIVLAGGLIGDIIVGLGGARIHVDEANRKAFDEANIKAKLDDLAKRLGVTQEIVRKALQALEQAERDAAAAKANPTPELKAAAERSDALAKHLFESLKAVDSCVEDRTARPDQK